MSTTAQPGDPEATLPSNPLGALRDHWDAFAEDYNSGPGRTTPTLVEAMLQDLEPGASLGGDVIDLACGAGRTTELLAQRCAPGSRVIGVDLSPVMIAAARADCRTPEIDFALAAADALPFPDASFDLAFCNLGLMLFPSPEAALAEIYRVLRPGGSLRATVWGRSEHSTVMSLLTDVAKELGIQLEQAPRSNFFLGHPDPLRAAAAGSGLELQDWHYKTLRFVYPNGAAACEEMGIREHRPRPTMKVLAAGDRRRLIAACRDEAERRLEAGRGALVLDSLVAVFG